MKELGIKSIVAKKFKPSSSKSDNLNCINLTKEKPTHPNQVWTRDITYIHTQFDGWVYLSTIMDRYTKQIIAWDISKRMNTDLVEDTLNQAIKIKGVSEGLILHSDQGSQYTSDSYEKLLKTHCIKHSFIRKGYPYIMLHKSLDKVISNENDYIVLLLKTSKMQSTKFSGRLRHFIIPNEFMKGLAT